ncbi:GM12367 [Drosophila sechellia]|uniref:GM12367 n=1 Tax=Drosophila sechellia TaxID=7238 RepID=B4I0U9_DROSE|nr:GM12367 [Drosophila sechellia]
MPLGTYNPFIQQIPIIDTYGKSRASGTAAICCATETDDFKLEQQLQVCPLDANVDDDVDNDEEGPKLLS